jgi:CubicO group peptidase (beta-lactamase class C family)
MADGPPGDGAVEHGALQYAVQGALTELVASGAETGLQAAVYCGGELVADAVAGLADPATNRPVTADTLFYAASTAKGVATSLAHVLAERGDLDYDLRLAAVWPEFGAHGKGQVTVRHVLQHTAGVPGLPPGTTAADLTDWDRMCAAVASQRPWWEPGSGFGYHVWTFGFLIGETIRRVTGAPISAVLREVLTGPLGVADEVLFGVPPRLLPAMARQVSPPAGSGARPAEPGSPTDLAMPSGVLPDAGYANDPGFLAADIPSCGTMSARGVARMYAALLGQLGAAPPVSTARLRQMAAVTFTGQDAVMGVPSALAFGYSPDRPGLGAARRGSSFGMVGANGSAAYADIDAGIAVAVMRNRFTVGDFTAAARVDRIIGDLQR